MKVTLQQIDTGNEEAIIRYRQMTQRIEDIVQYLEGRTEKIPAVKDGQQFLINIPDVIYLESVDGATFLYTQNEVYRIGQTLTLFAVLYADMGFFRCAKSVVLNIYRISRLKSLSGNRIDARMDNGEHIIISRRYAGELRRILKGEER
ncbi:MAG: LytTR family transcriptional regulator DNA-binding domain-containing protein [Clostridium sp.]|nr:LytTR family transcriptional regulator DNA-binding domain-containing protein [Clostridium sp.]